MIPRTDKSHVKLILNEVRIAAQSRWSFRQRLNLWFGENPDVPIAASLLILFGLLLILLLLGGLVGTGVFEYWRWCENVDKLGIERSWQAYQPVRQPTPCPTPTIALVTGIASALAFFCFVGGPSRKLHQTCLLYPHLDRSAGHYIATRTKWAFEILWAINLILFMLLTLSCDIGEFSWIGCLVYPPIQAAFHLSFVMLIAWKWKPSMENYLVPAVGVLLFIAGATALFPYPEVGEGMAKDLVSFHASSQRILYPPAWITNLWFSYEQMGLVSVFAVIGMVVWSIVEGARCCFRLQPLAPTDSLDEDGIALLNHVLAEDPAGPVEDEGAESEATCEQLVMRRIEELEKEESVPQDPLSVLRKAALEMLDVGELRKAPFWWRIIGSTFLFVAYAVPVMLVVGCIAACFVSPTDFRSQMIARTISAVLIVFPLLPACSTLINQKKAAIYPVGNQTIRRRMLKKYAAWFATVLPVWAILNLAFGCFYDIGVFEKVMLVAEPTIVGIAAMLLVLPFAGAGLKFSPTMTFLLLVSTAVAVTGVVLVGVSTVVTPIDAVANMEVLFGDSLIGLIRVVHNARALFLFACAFAFCVVAIAVKDYSNSDIDDPRTLVERRDQRCSIAA